MGPRGPELLPSVPGCPWPPSVLHPAPCSAPLLPSLCLSTGQCWPLSSKGDTDWSGSKSLGEPRLHRAAYPFSPTLKRTTARMVRATATARAVEGPSDLGQLGTASPSPAPASHAGALPLCLATPLGDAWMGRLPDLLSWTRSDFPRLSRTAIPVPRLPPPPVDATFIPIKLFKSALKSPAGPFVDPMTKKI